MTANSSSEFEREAQGKRQGFFAEFAQFLMENKKWWMIPIIAVLILVGALLIVGGSGVAPFIYTLF